jgi:ABC-type branched-subunit amino acid transport system substrate-binding protein
MSKFARAAAAVVALTLVVSACTEDSDDPGEASGSSSETTAAPSDGTEPEAGAEAEAIDYEALGLWDDGPCDDTRAPLVIGLMTVFQSPIVSLEDQAIALEAAATAFNARGGANGACIEVHTCDDRADPNQAIDCVREIDEAGVVATVNDQGTAAAGEVSAAMAAAGIPRVAGNVTSEDWDDQNAYPLDPSGTGGTFMHPSALLAAGVTEVGLIRVDLPAASALAGLIGDLYADDGLTIVSDVPVAAGPTDYSQFILASQDAGAGGVSLSLGEQEAVQVIRAAEQLDSDLEIALGTGTFSHGAAADLGVQVEHMVFDNAFPPATFDIPAYAALRADLAASGEELLQPTSLRSSPMRSWIGLYALLQMIRDADMQDFTRAGMTAMLQAATDVPMLGIFGDEAWTPNTNHPGLFQRHGVDHYAVYRFDPEAPAPDGLEGNFVELTETSFGGTLCGSIFGAQPPC